MNEINYCHANQNVPHVHVSLFQISKVWKKIQLKE